MADYIVLVVYILGIAWFGARFEKKKQINISLEETSNERLFPPSFKKSIEAQLDMSCAF